MSNRNLSSRYSRFLRVFATETPSEGKIFGLTVGTVSVSRSKWRWVAYIVTPRELFVNDCRHVKH